MRAIERLAEPTGSFADVGHPELCILGQLIGAVVRQEAARTRSVDLEPATRGQGIVCLREELGRIGNAAAELAGMDVVEGTTVSPFRLKVINLEHAIGRSPDLVLVRLILESYVADKTLPLRLNRAQICSENF